MKINKSSLLISVGLGFVLAFASIGLLFGHIMDSPDPPLITKILLWNIVLTVHLINTGILPSCGNCEMAALLYVIFYGFIIGLIGYSLAIFCGIWLIKKFRNNKEGLS